MHFESGASVPRDRYIQPRIEAEIAFVMEHGLDGSDPVTRDDVMSATRYVCPALEILDTRIVRQDPVSGVSRNVLDTIADNAANAGIVLGENRVPVNSRDLRWVGAIVSRNGVVEGNRSGSRRPGRSAARHRLAGRTPCVRRPPDPSERCRIVRIVHSSDRSPPRGPIRGEFRGFRIGLGQFFGLRPEFSRQIRPV